MAAIRAGFVSEVMARERYSSLHRHLLSVLPEPEYRTTFGELEAIPCYRLPGSARLCRPLWPTSKVGIGHGYALAWQAAEWLTREKDIEEETTKFVRRETPPELAEAPARRRRFSIREILPPHDPGPWPQDFTVSREQIYDDLGRLTGGPEDLSGDGR